MTPDAQELVEEVQQMMADALAGLVPVDGANAEVLGPAPFVILKPRENVAAGIEAAPLDLPTLRGFYAT
jgi:hypothetical protein